MNYETPNFDLASRSAIFMTRKQTRFPKCQFYKKKIVAALGKRWRKMKKKQFFPAYLIYTFLKFEVVENGLD